MLRLLIVLVFVLSGCSSVNLGNTVAGGQCGKVDYCVTFLAGQLFCVNAERSGCEVKEDENSTPD